MTSRKSIAVLFAAFFAVCFCIQACTQDDDGAISLSSGDDSYFGEGFFRKAVLDSGARIHLASDTLFLQMGNLWTFSNCALKRIEIDKEKDGESLVLLPKIIIETSGEDCPAPYYHPDTVLALTFSEDDLKGISQIRVMNDEDSLLDTILLRRGHFELDTFEIFVDSLFDSVSALPLRTKKSPSILKVLDSLTPRVFHWRAMKSNCELQVDICDSVVNDTIYPTSWSTTDTMLVPIRKACALGDSVYCVSTRWVNDSSSLGSVQKRADTLWHTSTYYVEEIPECASMNSFDMGAFTFGKKFTVVRELMIPDETETFCGPSATKDLFVFDITRNRLFPDSLDAESLSEIWKSKAHAIK
jgi:hypothetical protein